MYFHVYLIYRFTRTFTDHSSVITRCWGFELQNGKSSLKSPQTLATQDFAPASFLSTPDTKRQAPDGACRFFLFSILPLHRDKTGRHRAKHGACLSVSLFPLVRPGGGMLTGSSPASLSSLPAVPGSPGPASPACWPPTTAQPEGRRPRRPS